ncbi:TPA: replication initiation protein [Campylobacter jejuni]|nr:replication initiation protein [Campylobacter jejuni]
MSEIVKYDNNFNKLKIPNFNEQEQNLLFGIFAKMKDYQGQELEFYPNDLRNFLNSDYNNNQLYTFCFELFDKFFSANIRILIKNPETNTNKQKIINFFSTMELEYDNVAIPKNESINIEKAGIFKKLTLKVNPDFEHILYELTGNFTAFELSEFVSLSGKYTKTLYRLLKQFRTTGKAYFKWDEFCNIMDIPEKLAMCDIDKRILKPAIKELTKEGNLFDQVRVPFKNLAYEKEKTAGRGRGGKVSGISFTFKPENIQMQKLEKESRKIMTKEQQYLNFLINMKSNRFRFNYNDKLWQFNDFDFDKFKIIAIELIRDEYENLKFGNYMHFNTKNQEQFFKMIDTFKSGFAPL